MPRLIEIIILAIVQGLTEFLPISSSGHLAVLANIFKLEDIFELTVYMHFGTLLAILAVFRQQLAYIFRGFIKGRIIITRRIKITDKYLRLFFLIIIGSIPAALVAFFFKDVIETSFSSTRMVGLFLILTAVILFLTKLASNRGTPVNWWRAIVVGLFQALALFPGVSRSGTTISAGLFLGSEPANAFEFSFLLAIPAMIGANIIEFKKLATTPDFLAVSVGVLVSFVTGLFALSVLKKILIRKSFYLFSIYCVILGIVILLFST